MTVHVQVNAVGPTHAAVVAELHAASFLPDEQWHEAAMHELLVLHGVECGLAVWGNTPVGFVMIRCIAGEAEVLTLCVSPNFQNRGVGATLIAWALRQARRANSEELFLEVSTKNHVAKNLYKKNGFIKSGFRRDYYPDGSDAYVMNIKLIEEH